MRTFPDRCLKNNVTISPQNEDQKDDSLSDTQRSAISCLLESPSIQAAADKCGVSFRTLCDWLEIPAFVQEFNKVRRRNLTQVSAFVQSAATEAAETLMRLLKCGDPLIELRAARAILQTSQKSLESSEVEQRTEDQGRVNSEQADQIQALQTENASLLDFKLEFLKIMNTLVDGTFRRPEWLSVRTWEKIVRANELIAQTPLNPPTS